MHNRTWFCSTMLMARTLSIASHVALARVKDIGPDLFLKLETHGDRVRLAWTGLKEVTMPGHTKH